VKNSIRYRLYWIINLLVALSLSGCNNITPSITPKSNETVAIMTPTLTIQLSSKPTITHLTVSTRSPTFKAWLTWKMNLIMGIAWSPDNKQIATVAGDALGDTRVHIIDLPALQGSQFSEPAFDAVITFSPDGQELIVGLDELEVWKLSSKTLLGRLPSGLHSLFVTYLPGKSDSFILAKAYPLDGSNSSIEVVSLKSVGSTWESQPFLNVKGFLRAISLNGDGSLLATATKYFDNAKDDGEHVLVWDLASKKQICSIGGMNVAFGTKDTLGTAASDGISIWDAKTCVLIKHFSTGPGYLYNITFTPDGKLLAFASDKNRIVILDANSGEVVQELDGMLDYAEYIRFSPDGRFLATISRNVDPAKTEAVLIVWKVADGSLEPIEITPEFFKPAN